MQQPVFLLRLQETKSTIAQAKYAATLSSGAEAEVHMKKSKLKGTKTIDTPTEAQHETEPIIVKQKAKTHKPHRCFQRCGRFVPHVGYCMERCVLLVWRLRQVRAHHVVGWPRGLKLRPKVRGANLCRGTRLSPS